MISQGLQVLGRGGLKHILGQFKPSCPKQVLGTFGPQLPKTYFCTQICSKPILGHPFVQNYPTPILGHLFVQNIF